VGPRTAVSRSRHPHRSRPCRLERLHGFRRAARTKRIRNISASAARRKHRLCPYVLGGTASNRSARRQADQARSTVLEEGNGHCLRVHASSFLRWLWSPASQDKSEAVRRRLQDCQILQQGVSGNGLEATTQERVQSPQGLLCRAGLPVLQSAFLVRLRKIYRNCESRHGRAR
jgi:hypothetical protein